MDAECAESLSHGLLSGPPASGFKAFQCRRLWICALGLLTLLVGDKLSCGTSSLMSSVAVHTVTFLSDDDRAKKLKAVKKEGGKRGVEIEGASEMGGLQFFCNNVQEPEGDLELLMESVKAMNEQCPPTEEERRGCSGHVGKMIFSAGEDQLAIVAYIPEDKQDKVSGAEWLQRVIGDYGGSKIVGTDKDYSSAIIPKDGDKNIFPLKIRDNLIKPALDFLREKDLFPKDDKKDDSSSDMVFGDDYVPPEDYGRRLVAER